MPPGLCYPKSARLRRMGEFRALLDGGEVFPGRQALVRRLRRAAGAARLGVTVPRGYGGAVRRNRFRRLAREAFRGLAAGLGPMDLLLSPRRGLTAPTLAGLKSDLEHAARALPREPGPRPSRRR